MKYWTTYLILVASLIGCKGDVDFVTLIESTAEFNSIRLDNAFTVTLHEADYYSIEMTASDKRIDKIEWEVIDSTLIVRNTKRLGWLAPEHSEIELHIYSPPLDQVCSSGSCDIKTANPITSEEFGLILKNKVNIADLELNCGTFYYWNNGPSGGSLKLTGNSEILKIWNNAIMSVDAKDLSTNYAEISNASKGIISASPNIRLNYSIIDVGDIHIYSDPEEIVIEELTGEGDIIFF